MRRPARVRARQGAGEGILEPFVLGAVAVLVLNDHLLKGLAPGGLTGKLSDVAGLGFFPLFLQALWEVGQAAAGVYRRPSVSVLGAAVLVTGLAFSAVQLSESADTIYRWGMGALRWPAYALLDALGGRGLEPIRPVASWPDPTDLLALPALAVAWRVGLRRTSLSTRRAPI